MRRGNSPIRRLGAAWRAGAMAVAAAAGLAAGTAAAAQTPVPDDEIARRAAALFAGGEIQETLPGAGEAAAGEAEGSRTLGSERRTRGVHVPGTGALSGFLVWIALGVAAAIVLFQLGAAAVRHWRSRAGAAPGPADPAAASGAAAAGPGGDPAELARAGRHAEAVHRLLLIAIEALVPRLPHGLYPGITSREIARAARLDAAGRGAFERIAGAVERHLFGGEPLGAGDWERCSDAFRELRGSLGAAG